LGVFYELTVLIRVSAELTGSPLKS
jgi:hypothetical protein